MVHFLYEEFTGRTIRKASRQRHRSRDLILLDCAHRRVEDTKLFLQLVSRWQASIGPHNKENFTKVWQRFRQENLEKNYRLEWLIEYYL